MNESQSKEVVAWEELEEHERFEKKKPEDGKPLIICQP